MHGPYSMLRVQWVAVWSCGFKVAGGICGGNTQTLWWTPEAWLACEILGSAAQGGRVCGKCGKSLVSPLN